MAPDNDEGDAEDRVNIDYIKGTLFRTISPTGLIGSITPEGKVQIALYSERQAIPQRVSYKLSSDGVLGDVIEVIGRDAIVREIDAVVTFDLDTARKLIGFLKESVHDLEIESTPKETE